MATIIENYLRDPTRRVLVIDALTDPVERGVYDVDSQADVNAIAASVDASRTEIRKQREIADNIGRALTMANAPLTFIHCTVTEVLNAARALYKTATQREAVFLGGALADRNLTNAQLANLFNVGNPSAELTAIKNKLTAAQTLRNSVLAEAGA